MNAISFATDNSFQEFNLSTVFTPFTALIFLVSMFNAVVSRTITVKFPWKIPSTESMFRERSVTPVSLLMTEVMLVTIAMSSRPMTRSVTIYPLSPLPDVYKRQLFAFKTAEEGGYYLENQKELNENGKPYVGVVNGFAVMQATPSAAFEVQTASAPTANEEMNVSRCV